MLKEPQLLQPQEQEQGQYKKFLTSSINRALAKIQHHVQMVRLKHQQKNKNKKKQTNVSLMHELNYPPKNLHNHPILWCVRAVYRSLR